MNARCLPLLLAAAAPSIAQEHDPLSRRSEPWPTGLQDLRTAEPRATPHVNRPSAPRLPAEPAESIPDRAEGDLPMGTIAQRVADSMRDRVHFDVDLRGDHWARGARYKVRAGTDGFEFIPALGPDVERNHPVRMRLESISRGGELVPLEEAAKVRREGHRLLLDRGPVEVRYDVALGSVEQSFALDVPEGVGDLVVRIAIETDLEVRVDDGGFLMSGEDGGMRYGEAFSIAGSGDARPAPAAFDGSEIEIRVPASDLPAPGQALVVDPVLTPVLVDDTVDDLRRPDLAYERIRDGYLFVYEENFSTADQDVYSIFVDATTFLTSNPRYIDMTSTAWRRPKVATVQADRTHLVVATGQDSGMLSNIVGRFRRASDGWTGPQFILKGATPDYFCLDPVVGGDNFAVSGQSHFCVAYNRFNIGSDRDLYAIIFDTAGNYVRPEIPLEFTPLIDSAAPAISRSTGNPNLDALFCIAWPQTQGAFGRVTGAQLSWDGATVLGPFDVAPPVPNEEYFSVNVSCLSEVFRGPGADQVYLVAYDDQSTIVSDSLVAMCAGTDVLSTTQLTRAEHAEEFVDQNAVVIATHPDSFTLVYEEADALYVTVVEPVAERLGILERRIRFHDGEPNAYDTAVATAYSGGGTNVDGLIAFSDGSAGSADILTSYFFPDPIREVAGYQFCYGVPNSTGDRGFIAAFGDSSPFSTKTLGAFALPQNAAGFFLASQTTGFIPMPGGSQGTLCLSGSIGRFGLYSSGGLGQGFVFVDPQAIPSPTGTVAAIIGDRWSFQSWHRDSIGGVATSNFTNGVTVVFD
ncbi:MAG: hypothetical protein AAGB93_14240 [Planctomycetota bacterium]